jgi:hypothetical protein
MSLWLIFGLFFFSLFFCRSLNERKSLELIVFQMLLEDKDSSWQYTMGKLLALDHLLSKATVSPEEKDSEMGSEQSHPQTTKSYSQKSLGRDPLFVALDLSFQNLSNSHSRVAKMALKGTIHILRQQNLLYF